MIRVRLVGYDWQDTREFYFKRALLAGFFALIASHRDKYQRLDLEVLTEEQLKAEIFQKTL